MGAKSNTSGKNKKITIAIVVVILLLIAGVIAAVAILNSQKRNNETTNQESTELNQNPNSNVQDDDAYVISRFIDLSYNNSDPQTMAERSDGIAIVKIKSLDGVSNYGNGVQQYVYPYTYGQMGVIQTLKGDIKEGDTVKFSRLGGTMSFDEYLESLSETERAKFANQNTEKKQAKITFDGDIDIEVGKTYLVYLKNSNVHYAEPGAYEIIGFEGGLREIQATSDYSVNSDLKVLNNFTGEWENLSDVIKR